MTKVRDFLSPLYAQREQEEKNLARFIEEKDIENIQRTVETLYLLDEKIFREEKDKRMYSYKIEVDCPLELSKINSNSEKNRLFLLKVLKEIMDQKVT